MATLLGREIVDKQIIDVIHGTCLGKVRELYCDAYITAVAAVSIGYDATRNHGIVRGDDIVLFGKDAVLVKHTNVAVVADHLLAGWLSRTQLIGIEVRTLDGKRLGAVDDVIGEGNTVALSGLMVRLDRAQIGETRLQALPVSAVRAMGSDDSLIVDVNLEEGKSATPS